MKKVSILLSLLVLLVMAVMPTAAQDTGTEVTVWFSEDASFSVALPTDWAAGENPDGGIAVGNSEDTLAAMMADEGNPLSGQFGFNFSAVPVAALADLGLAEDATLGDIATTISGFAAADNEDNLVFGELLEFEYGGKLISALDGRSDVMDATLAVYEIAPDYIGLVFMGFALNEGATHGVEAFDVLGTVRFSPPIEAVYDDGSIAFNYPDGWLTQIESGVVIVANSEEAVAAQVFEDDHFGMLVAPYALTGGTATTIDEAASQVAQLIFGSGAEVEFSDPLVLEVLEREAAIVDVTNADSGSGAVWATTDPNGDLVVVVYYASDRNSYQMGLLALNVALSINNVAEVE